MLRQWSGLKYGEQDSMISAEEKMPPTEVASASQNEALSRLERVRLKNSKAQKKYRQKKLVRRTHKPSIP